MGNLEVVIPPDILNDNESSESGGVAVEGGTIRLRCHAVGIPDPTVSWRREDSRNLVLRQEGGRDKKGKEKYTHPTSLVVESIFEKKTKGKIYFIFVIRQNNTSLSLKAAGASLS